MGKPDDAAELAKTAYSIYRGMKEDPMTVTHWDDLSREQRGLFEWVVRYVRLHDIDR